MLSATIPFCGYVPEQIVRLKIRINNQCGFDCYRTIISLRKVFTFISTEPEIRSTSETKTLLKNVIGGAKSGAETKLSGLIEIPKFTLPSNETISSIVKVNYFIQVNVDIVGFLGRPKVKLPIVIGTKALKFSNKRF